MDWAAVATWAAVPLTVETSENTSTFAFAARACIRTTAPASYRTGIGENADAPDGQRVILEDAWMRRAGQHPQRTLRTSSLLPACTCSTSRASRSSPAC